MPTKKKSAASKTIWTDVDSFSLTFLNRLVERMYNIYFDRKMYIREVKVVSPRFLNAIKSATSDLKRIKIIARELL